MLSSRYLEAIIFLRLLSLLLTCAPRPVGSSEKILVVYEFDTGDPVQRCKETVFPYMLLLKQDIFEGRLVMELSIAEG